jgi:hypothetical protein
MHLLPYFALLVTFNAHNIHTDARKRNTSSRFRQYKARWQLYLHAHLKHASLSRTHDTTGRYETQQSWRHPWATRGTNIETSRHLWHVCYKFVLTHQDQRGDRSVQKPNISQDLRTVYDIWTLKTFWTSSIIQFSIDSCHPWHYDCHTSHSSGNIKIRIPFIKYQLFLSFPPNPNNSVFIHL